MELTLFPFDVTSLTHTHTCQSRSTHPSGLLPSQGLAGAGLGPRPSLGPACPTDGRFTCFSLLSVWLLVSMAKQEFPNGLFPFSWGRRW